MQTEPTLLMPALMREDPAAEVVRAALDVHGSLGPGLEADMYLRAMEVELEARGLRFWRDVTVELDYKGRRLGISRVPLVAGGVLIGIRVSPLLGPGDVALLTAQARSLGSGGLLFNFGGERLELRRVRPKRREGPRGSAETRSRAGAGAE